MQIMRILQILTFLFVVALVPVTGIGAYFSYTESRARVEELNDITPLTETDEEKVVRLVLGLSDVDDVETTANTTVAAPAFTNDLIIATAVPTEAAIASTDGASDDASTAGTDPNTATDSTTTEPDTTETVVTVDPESVTSSAPDDPRRVTVLLMGIDQRSGEEGRFRTDTMILLSLDPIGRTGAMLSIPRDLYVDIPTTPDQQRINTANYIGDDPALQYPGGGPALAMLTVERVLGVAVDHYVLVNFSAFTTFVDVIGPIEICVQELIDDPKYPDGSYGYLPIVIEPGCQDMDAERLLQYARTRATEGGDFDRSRRQQEVILAVRDNILSAGGVSALLGDALTIWESVSQNVTTDLTLDELIELALLASDVTDIRQGTISEGEVIQGTGQDGSQVLIPIQTDIFSLVADLFRPPTRPAADTDDFVQPDPNNVPLVVREEAPIIELLNGTEIQGRAGALSEFVQSYNLDVGYIGNANTAGVTETYVVYYGEHAESAAYLAQVLAVINGFNIPRVERQDGTPPTEANVIVVIGTDLAVPQVSNQ